jgi:deoxyribodipyrimidine photo-lyase
VKRSETIIVWFRNDLRTHDHQPLSKAVANARYVLPVYILDPRQFKMTTYGFPKTGNYRLRFLYESISDLRTNLRKADGDLIVRFGYPETLLPQLARECKATSVYYHEEAASEEKQVEKLVQENLLRYAIEWDSWWGSTLVAKEDLPFTIPHLPHVFTKFRTAVEQQVVFPEPLPSPEKIDLPVNSDCGEWPSDYIPAIQYDTRAAYAFKGGETAALRRLDAYIWQHDALRTYELTRNGLIGEDYSTKFSPWLALGSVSPRLIYQQVKRYEAERVKNKSTYWLIFELLWRDFFRFTGLKAGSKLFQLNGFNGTDASHAIDSEHYEKWKQGQTGFPFIDANMRELLYTGFMSNRGRQNVASFFVHDLGLDWRAGAAWFETQLIDYDPCSNWGNWAYIAGVGNDPRPNRYFNSSSQSGRYDAQGEYIRLWCPELKEIPLRYLHHLHQYAESFLREFGVVIGEDYPTPCIQLTGSARQFVK